MEHFCTYFDQGYLPRGLALYESLRRHSPAFTLWILCMDEPSRRALEQLALPGVNTVGLAELEAAVPELATAKADRSRIEYYFTCTPVWTHHLLTSRPEIERLTYLDADLYFFADPQAVFDEMKGASVGIVPHGYAEAFRHLERYGIYNVGWNTFCRDEHGLACLSDWRARCLAWCYDRAEDGKFADQKYLDAWPERFERVAVITHPGVNAAPWNLGNHPVRQEGEQVLIGERPLIFFHFHGYKQQAPWLINPNLKPYGARPTRTIRQAIYAPYVKALNAATRRAAPLLEAGRVGRSIRGGAADQPWARWKRRARAWVDTTAGICLGRFLFVIDDRVL